MLLTRPLTTLVREGAARLEREKRYGEAITTCERLLACYIPDDFRNHIIQRMLIDLEKVARPSRALTIAEEALVEASDPALCHDLMNRRSRLAKRERRYGPPPPKLLTPKKRRFQAICVPTATGARNRFVAGSSDNNDEAAALQYYREMHGYDGTHVENALLGALTAVCFWDIIFMVMPGVLLHELQAGPFDGGNKPFYCRREKVIRERLEEIREDSHRSRALRILSEKDGIANP